MPAKARALQRACWLETVQEPVSRRARVIENEAGDMQVGRGQTRHNLIV